MRFYRSKALIFIGLPGESSWIQPTVETALKYDIVTSARSLFEPDRDVTRAEAYAMIMRAVCLEVPAARKAQFATWQEGIHDYAQGNGLTNRSWDGFESERPILRQELFVLASRAADWAEKTGGCNPRPSSCPYKGPAIVNTPVVPSQPVVTVPTYETPIMSVDYLAGYTRDYVLGDVAPEIRVIQKLLNNNGYTIANSGAGSKGQETDKLGLATQEALRRFQRSRDIPMTGNVGEQTYKALMDLQNGVVQTPAPVVSEPVPIVTAPVIETPVTALIQFTRNYVLGDVAPEIRIIQQLLNNNGYTIANSGAGSKGKETDKLGLATQEAIRRFQRDRGIEMTGNVGEQTYNALLQLQSGNVVAEPVVVAPVVPIPEVVVPPVQENVTRLTTFTQVYEVGDIAPEILVIQKLLNNNGYTIANSGAGSKGQETDKLGLATQEAIRRFQRDNGIPMTGNVGEQTYNALKALQPAAKKTGPDIIDV